MSSIVWATFKVYFRKIYNIFTNKYSSIGKPSSKKTVKRGHWRGGTSRRTRQHFSKDTVVHFVKTRFRFLAIFDVSTMKTIFTEPYYWVLCMQAGRRRRRVAGPRWSIFDSLCNAASHTCTHLLEALKHCNWGGGGNTQMVCGTTSVNINHVMAQKEKNPFQRKSPMA